MNQIQAQAEVITDRLFLEHEAKGFASVVFNHPTGKNYRVNLVGEKTIRTWGRPGRNRAVKKEDINYDAVKAVVALRIKHGYV